MCPPFWFCSPIEHIQDVMFPVFYACEEGGVTPSLASQFKSTIDGPVDMIHKLVLAAVILLGKPLVKYSNCTYLIQSSH